MRLWSLLTVCVEQPRRTSENVQPPFAAEDRTVAVNVSPTLTVRAETEEIVGRAAAILPSDRSK